MLERLNELFIRRGVPKYLRRGNGPEFTSSRVRQWLQKMEVNTLFMEPGSLWENRYVESFHGKMLDQLLNTELFDTLLEAKVLIERWRVHDNTERPHRSLGGRPPAPTVIASQLPASATLQQTVAEYPRHCTKLS